MKNKYQRLSKDEKERIRKMTLDGKSLNQIVNLTGLGKTTIYYNVKDLKSRQWRKLIVNLSEEKIGELMGAFAGDGSYYHPKKGGSHKIRFSLSISRDMKYAEYLIDLLKKLNLNPFLFKKEKENALDVTVNSKEFIEFIYNFLCWEGKRTYSIKLKEDLDKYSEDFLKGFVRGLMDTDGYVKVSNVSFGVVSEGLIKNLAQILDKFNLKYKLSTKIREPLRRNLFLIRIYRNSLDKYYTLIGFSNLYKLEALKKIIKINGDMRI